MRVLVLSFISNKAVKSSLARQAGRQASLTSYILLLGNSSQLSAAGSDPATAGYSLTERESCCPEEIQSIEIRGNAF